MKNIINKIKNSVEWEIILEMTKPKIVLLVIALNIAGFSFMYLILDLQNHFVNLH